MFNTVKIKVTCLVQVKINVKIQGFDILRPRVGYTAREGPKSKVLKMEYVKCSA